VLSQSPVLARMLAEKPQANAERELNLPEDAVEEFGKVLMYLYSKEFPIKNAKDLESTSSELANMYLVAHKYELDGLKKLTLKKLEDTIGPVDHPERFLTIAQTISSAIAPSDPILHDFLRGEICHLLGLKNAYNSKIELTKNVQAKLQLLVSQGGPLAVDIFEAQFSVGSSRTKQAKEASAKDKRDIEECQKSVEKYKESVVKWKENAEKLGGIAEEWEEHHASYCGEYECDFWRGRC